MTQKHFFFGNTFAKTCRRIILYIIALTGCAFLTTSCKPKQPKEAATHTIDSVIPEETLPTDTLVITNKPLYDRFGTRQLPMPPQGLTGKAIELVADPSIYPDTVSKIKVVLHNSAAGRVTTGLHYNLEKYNKGKWLPLKFMDNHVFLDIGLILEEGSSLEYLTLLFPEENHYTPGKYRVTKENLFKFETNFTVDSNYHLRMTDSNHLGDAFEMTVPEVISNQTQRIDTIRVLITNNSKNQELINTDDFALSLRNGDNQIILFAKQYSGFQEKTYPLKPGKTMEFKIPVMSDKYRFDNGVKQPFGPGEYTIVKWSKVDLYAEFELKALKK